MEKLNIFRSWKSDFFHGDIINALCVYTDKELDQIRAHGYNGIWVGGKLHEIIPSKIFPEFGKNHAKYLGTLRALVRRARRYKLSVYICFIEPLGFLVENTFWKNHKDVRGERYCSHYDPKTFHYALCTSTSKVRENPFVVENGVQNHPAA